jgi:hypothetical protein
MASNVLSPADKPPEKGADHAWAMLSRIANQQFGDFEDLGSIYGRALLLYGDCASQAEAQQGVTLTGVLREATGLDIEEAMFLAFAIFSLLSQGNLGHLLERDIMTSSPEFPGLTAERVGRLFDWLSIDYEGFRRAGELPEAGAEEGYEPYNLNPLVRYPIVRTTRGQYVIPIVPYLFRRVTTGLFYDLIASPHGGKVGNIIGKAIESYIRKLIEDLPLHGALTPETEYAAGRTTCDWILDDPDGVVVIECKHASLKQRARTTGKREDIERDLNDKKGGVVDGIAKLAETAEAIRSGQLQGVESSKRIVGLLVTLNQFFLGNTRYMRSMIEAGLKERGVELGDFQYQVCPVPDFEALCKFLVAARQTLSWAIASKVDGTRNVPRDLPTLEWDFASWAHHVWPEGAEGRIQALDKVFDGGLDRLANRFRNSNLQP